MLGLSSEGRVGLCAQILVRYDIRTSPGTGLKHFSLFPLCCSFIHTVSSLSCLYKKPLHRVPCRDATCDITYSVSNSKK